MNKYFAAIDMGTNSFHLIIVEVKKDGKFKIIDRDREVIRLASRKGNELSIISAEEIEKSVNIINRYVTLAKTYNAEIKAVATSAIREATNRDDYVKTIFERTGLQITVLNGKNEALLIFQGIQKALNIEDKNVICFDIGGGSSEIVYAQKSKIIISESIKIGAVRLSKKFFPDYIITEKAIKDCEAFIYNNLTSNFSLQKKLNFDIAVGTSGTIQSTASLISFKKHKFPSSLNKYKFTHEEFINIFLEVISHKSLKERMNIPGIEQRRADILPAGLIIMKVLFEYFDVKEMIISEYALREGVVLDMLYSQAEYP
ncbi:MAG: Ppx/GppA phosphatase family protein [Syntrophothermus sp.]|nr:hypothetical protein [Ignavibacteriaceae bacterium]